ncbi:hypothetical protein K450DRAFT_222245 [Umbelopsis ramanniana AG]|uniref:Serine/threonine-protein kinase ATR n=1 Tax=Umbelopsis ramanniana AG TaxID=1314678 RepID=A0AAD5EH93_UMBRA|nr:uncharacterized protein K450DRAFT_222245 [Umbelopsis ramanniana AG]KAI8583673.1 hypothetical protein K450DRAFT_222245 [Umbelopsis ramanniana AG]
MKTELLPPLITSIKNAPSSQSRRRYCDQVTKLAEHLCQSKHQLLHSYEQEICAIIGDNLSTNLQLASDIAYLYDSDLENFLKFASPVVLPYLIVERKRAGLDALADAMHIRLSDLCVQHAYQIAKSILTQKSEDKYTAAIEFFELITDSYIGIQELIELCEVRLVQNLALELSGAAEGQQIYSALDRIAKILHLDGVTALLSNHMLNILTYMDTLVEKVQKRQVDAPNVQVFNSLIYVIQETRSNINRHISYIAATIVGISQLTDGQNIAVDCWGLIISVLQPADKSKCANIIVGSLASLLCRSEINAVQKIVDLLKSLVTTDGKNVEDYAVALNIPNRPELRKINDMINSSRRAVPLKQQLENWIGKAYDGDVNDVEVALRSIHIILTTKPLDEHQNLVTGYQGWLEDDQRNQVYNLLLELCQRRISVESVQILIAKCLGALGAADPKRINVSVSDHRFVMMENFVDMDENRFLALYIIQNYLYRALLESQNGSIQRRVQFSIQTLLRYCGFTMNMDGVQSTTTHDNLWNELSADCRAAVAPLLTSSLACNWTWQRKYSTIYDNTESFDEWLIEWTMSLITASKGEAYTVFNSCSPLILTKNIAIATQLVPHIALNNVINMQGKDILREIMSVLEAKGNHSEQKRQACLQVIVNVVEHCSIWIRRMKEKLGSRVKSRALDLVTIFIDTIPHGSMAKAAYQCKAYARALLELEQDIRAHGMKDDSFGLFLRIHAHLDDADTMNGLRETFTPKYSQELELLLLESNSKWDLAEYHYESLNSNSTLDRNNVVGYLNCLQKQFKYESILSMSSTFQKQNPDITSSVIPFMVEAAWHQQEWDMLDSLLSKVTEHTISTRIAKVIACLRNRDRQGVYRALQQARIHCVQQLADGKLESYVRSYDDILNLQILSELETSFMYSDDQNTSNIRMNSFTEEMGDWHRKLEWMSPALKYREYLLDIRETALRLLDVDGLNYPLRRYLVDGNLHRYKAAMKEGSLQKAYHSLVKAEYQDNERTIVARAKYLWKSNQNLDAVQFLSEQTMDSYTLLLLTRWKQELGMLSPSKIETEYRRILYDMSDANDLQLWGGKNWKEKAHYYLGSYYDKIFMSSDDVIEEQYLRRAKAVCVQYVLTMENGSKFLYNAMPRLLTIWLELGTVIANDTRGSQANVRQIFKEINNILLNSSIPPQSWTVVLPRMVSRLDHQNGAICQTLIGILKKIFRTFPRSTVWHLIAHINGSDGQNPSSRSRSLHCESILKKTAVGEEGRTLLRIVDQAKILVRYLKELAQHPYEASSRNQSLPASMVHLKDIDICVPIEAALMPSTSMITDLPTIARFGPKVMVMSSLQKPRRITMIGSDGKHYKFLCKSNDDLRKDARMMEFNVMINTFLRKDRDARERSLSIRTYAVTPLGDLWGLIEWVNHTKPLKVIVHEQLTEIGKDISKLAQFTKRELDANNLKSAQERIWSFENKVLPECPAVLHRWFSKTFREPSQWLAARTQFSRTLATMSIVGYILGLGDRHAENILLHEITGDVVHVDVNMLFDRGQKLPVPEVVPFRLTQNLLDAMGPSGYEGTYRKSCEIVLRVLQQNKMSLLSVFETLVHDPIVEWKRYGERQTIQARAKRQLDGIERKIDATGNSIQDEVSRLIEEATSNSNLATMFIGTLNWVYKVTEGCLM